MLYSVVGLISVVKVKPLVAVFYVVVGLSLFVGGLKKLHDINCRSSIG